MAITLHAKAERKLLGIGTAATLLGIALSVGGSAVMPGILTLAGLACLLVGLHRFGRTGPDPARVRQRPAARRREKRVRREPTARP